MAHVLLLARKVTPAWKPTASNILTAKGSAASLAWALRARVAGFGCKRSDMLLNGHEPTNLVDLFTFERWWWSGVAGFWVSLCSPVGFLCPGKKGKSVEREARIRPGVHRSLR